MLIRPYLARIPGARGAERLAPGYRVAQFEFLAYSALFATAVIALWFSILAAAVITFLLAHMFLFHSVLRMSMVLKQTWGLVFSGLMSAAIQGYLHWPIAFAGVGVATVGVALIELGSRSYHGAFWQRLNPSLQSGVRRDW